MMQVNQLFYFFARLKKLTFVMVCILSTVFSVAVFAQNKVNDQAWFGIDLPPAFDPHSTPVIIGDRGPVPALVPVGEENYLDLSGLRIRQDLETIVGFSKTSREEREIGAGQIWGRISGFPSGENTIEWAATQYRNAGIADVEIQSFEQDPEATFWLPTSWEMRLMSNSLFGAESEDVILQSAMPLSPSELPEGVLDGQLIYVGTGSSAELIHMDLLGKIAVQHVTPQAHLVFERNPTVPRARALFERGAVAVINIIDQPGNKRARDFSNCGGPCFNLGGRDGAFLEAVMNSAAVAGTLDQLRVKIKLQTELKTGLSAKNAIAIIAGKNSEEAIVVNAHADAWFDGAGDNGDGLAVQIALARHFSKPENQPDRTLVFVASAGHHSPGLHGPRNFVAMNEELAQKAVLVFNIEHVAQRNISPARSLFDDGYREFVADSGEAPIVAGITNEAPFLEGLFRQGVQKYGTNFVSGTSTMASGEGGGYRQLEVAIVTTMQAPPLYHTSGEVTEVISTPGLERMARFLAYFIKEVAKAAADQINP